MGNGLFIHGIQVYCLNDKRSKLNGIYQNRQEYFVQIFQYEDKEEFVEICNQSEKTILL